MEFNPVEKVNELIDTLKKFNPTIRKKTDEGYEWLEEDTDVCIEILNPDSYNPDDGLTIICEDDGEFTLCFGAHYHYWGCDEEYNQMCQDALDILKNKMCSANILSGEGKKWIGGGWLRCDEIDLPIKDVFFFLNLPIEYEAHYSFWDNSLNKIIRVRKNEK